MKMHFMMTEEGAHLLSRPTWDRLRRIMVFSDSHATRFTVTLAELLMVLSFVFDPGGLQFQSLVRLGPASLWVSVVALTALLQLKFLLKGKYNGKDAVWFSAWDSLWWIFMTSAMYTATGSFPVTQTAITAAASWVFVSSGFTAYGKRGTDYGDASRRIRT